MSLKTVYFHLGMFVALMVLAAYQVTTEATCNIDCFLVHNFNENGKDYHSSEEVCITYAKTIDGTVICPVVETHPFNCSHVDEISVEETEILRCCVRPGHRGQNSPGASIKPGSGKILMRETECQGS